MKKVRLSALEYLKERKESEYYKELKHQKLRNEKEGKTRLYDLANACQRCKTIRSYTEIRNGTCDNCGKRN